MNHDDLIMILRTWMFMHCYMNPLVTLILVLFNFFIDFY